MWGMANSNKKLMTEIEAFLSTTGMGASYFGKVAAGNSELVARLRKDGRVWPETAAKVRGFMRRRRVLDRGDVAGASQRQEAQAPHDT